MYNLKEYGDNYLKTSGGLWQQYRDETPLDTAFHLNLKRKQWAK